MNDYCSPSINKRYSYNYNSYPSCCVAALVSDFQQFGKRLEFKEKENVWEYLHNMMISAGHSIAILMDLEDGQGYEVFKDCPKIQFLSSTFNKNSGNIVYLMEYTV